MFLDDVGVTIAMITVTLLAVVVVVLKVLLFSDKVQSPQPQGDSNPPIALQLDPSVSTFSPLEQQVKSNIRYTGKGFIPCDG